VREVRFRCASANHYRRTPLSFAPIRKPSYRLEGIAAQETWTPSEKLRFRRRWAINESPNSPIRKSCDSANRLSHLFSTPTSGNNLAL
jgi:hypothetical protein